MRSARPGPAFTAVHLPRPLDADRAQQLLTRIAASPDLGPIMFEARGNGGRVEHLLAAAPHHLDAVKRLAGGLLEDVAFTPFSAPRGPVEIAGRVRMSPTTLALSAPDATDATRVLLAALAAARLGELAVMQIVLGPRLVPKAVPRRLPDPTTGIWDLLTRGAESAPLELRTQTRERIGALGFSLTIRLGAAAKSTGRAQALLRGLLGAIRTLQSPGVRIDLVREKRTALERASVPWRWPLRLSARELVTLLAWPYGEQDLPGVAPLHPRPLRAATAAETSERDFARALAPGDGRLLGISARDALQHTLLLGPTGAGKSNVLLHLIGADIAAGRSVVVIDPKQDLVTDALSLIPRERFDDVVLLDATDARPVGFNPLTARGRDPDVVVDGLMSTLEAVFADGWGPRTADILSACLRTLARAANTDNNGSNLAPSLMDVPRLLTEPALRRRYIAPASSDAALVGFWAWYDDLGPAGQAAAIAAPMNKWRQLLLRPALVRVLGPNPRQIDIRGVFDRPTILLVPLNEGLLGTGAASLLGSLLVAELWHGAQARARRPAAQRRPAMVFLDEAHRFLHLPVGLADALAVSRSLGVGWHLATQYRDQFPLALRRAVDTNARSKIVLAPALEDAKAYAQTSRGQLTTEDFTALGQYEAYAALTTGGTVDGWVLTKTLPPPRPVTQPGDLLTHLRTRPQQATAPTQPSAHGKRSTGASTVRGSDRGSPEDGARSGASVNKAPVGRRRRKPS